MKRIRILLGILAMGWVCAAYGQVNGTESGGASSSGGHSGLSSGHPINQHSDCTDVHSTAASSVSVEQEPAESSSSASSSSSTDEGRVEACEFESFEAIWQRMDAAGVTIKLGELFYLEDEAEEQRPDVQIALKWLQSEGLPVDGLRFIAYHGEIHRTNTASNREAYIIFSDALKIFFKRIALMKDPRAFNVLLGYYIRDFEDVPCIFQGILKDYLGSCILPVVLVCWSSSIPCDSTPFTQMYQRLISVGADVNCVLNSSEFIRVPPGGRSYPLHLAVSNGNVEAVEFLLASGANPFLLDYNSANLSERHAIWIAEKRLFKVPTGERAQYKRIIELLQRAEIRWIEGVNQQVRPLKELRELVWRVKYYLDRHSSSSQLFGLGRLARMVKPIDGLGPQPLAELAALRVLQRAGLDLNTFRRGFNINCYGYPPIDLDQEGVLVNSEWLFEQEIKSLWTPALAVLLAIILEGEMNWRDSTYREIKGLEDPEAIAKQRMRALLSRCFDCLTNISRFKESPGAAKDLFWRKVIALLKEAAMEVNHGMIDWDSGIDAFPHEEQCVLIVLEEGGNPNIGDGARFRTLLSIYALMESKWLIFRTETEIDLTAHLRVTNALLEHGADIRGRGAHGGEILHHSLELHPLVIDWLLRRGAQINAINFQGSTPLHNVCNSYNHNSRTRLIVQLLLDRGADPLERDNNGRTPRDVLEQRRDFDREVAWMLRRAELAQRYPLCRYVPVPIRLIASVEDFREAPARHIASMGDYARNVPMRYFLSIIAPVILFCILYADGYFNEWHEYDRSM